MKDGTLRWRDLIGLSCLSIFAITTGSADFISQDPWFLGWLPIMAGWIGLFFVFCGAVALLLPRIASALEQFSEYLKAKTVSKNLAACIVLAKITFSLFATIAMTGTMLFVGWHLSQMGSIDELKQAFNSLSRLEQFLFMVIGAASPFLAYHFFQKAEKNRKGLKKCKIQGKEKE